MGVKTNPLRLKSIHVLIGSPGHPQTTLWSNTWQFICKTFKLYGICVSIYKSMFESIVAYWQLYPMKHVSIKIDLEFESFMSRTWIWKCCLQNVSHFVSASVCCELVMLRLFFLPPWGCFKNTYELLNVRALKFPPVDKIHIFQCMDKIFCVDFKGTIWNSTQNILPIHWKIWFLYIEIVRALRFKSSYVFLKCPQMCHQCAGVLLSSCRQWANIYWVCSQSHYSDVIMSAKMSRINGVLIVCSTICSGTDQRKHQSSRSLAFVRGIHQSTKSLTLKQWETHGCVVSTVATDALALKHQAISIHNAD